MFTALTCWDAADWSDVSGRHADMMTLSQPLGSRKNKHNGRRATLLRNQTRLTVQCLGIT